MLAESQTRKPCVFSAIHKHFFCPYAPVSPIPAITCRVPFSASAANPRLRITKLSVQLTILVWKASPRFTVGGGQEAES